MDIKLGKFNRLRFDEHDVLKLQAQQMVTDTYQITPDLRLTVTALIDRKIGRSAITYGPQRILLMLARTDFEQIMNTRIKDEGLPVDNFLVQFDLRGYKQLRSPHEYRMD